jgi:5'-nucleotidase
MVVPVSGFENEVLHYPVVDKQRQPTVNVAPNRGPTAHRLVVAISSRALFRLEDSNSIFEEQGLAGYADHQVSHENELLEPGIAFPLVKKLLALRHPETELPLVEVILLSRNNADTGLRIFNSIEHYGLDIQRAAFTGGRAPHRYLASFGARLYLSASAENVKKTLQAGFAAARILPGDGLARDGAQLRIAFDGDAVIFGDEAERIYQESGIEAFSIAEKDAAAEPLSGGPFKPLLESLHQIQAAFPPSECPLRTALVTARGAPAHKRVILTLREWGVRIDEALFLGGRSKAEFLRSFGADIFFDDQMVHCDEASQLVATGHVPHGIANEGNPRTYVE